MFYIYLDTSFLSQFAKEVRGTTGTSFSNGKWINLLTVLREGVKRGILLCPASQFQTEEAMLAEGLLQEFASLQFELSKGYYFKKWQDILVHQVANQVLIYLKRPHDIDLGWKAFTRMPPPVRDPLTTVRTKSNMVQYAEFVKPLREKFSRRGTYSGHYKAEKVDFLKQTFLNPNSDFSKMLISEAKVREKEVPTLFTFLNNESINHKYIDHVHFISIFCSLWASIIFHEPNRTYKDGDLLDVVALACAFPHCQIITTDSNMKNFIERLGFDEKHGISVYAPTAKDLDDFVKAVSDLVSR